MSKRQKGSVYTAILVLAIFLGLSLITQNWGFSLWSILPVFLVLMLMFSTKRDKKSIRR